LGFTFFMNFFDAFMKPSNAISTTRATTGSP
jgi:hypothetical protein